LFFDPATLQQFRDDDLLDIDEDPDIMAMLVPGGGKCRTVKKISSFGSAHAGKSKLKGPEGEYNLADVLKEMSSDEAPTGLRNG